MFLPSHHGCSGVLIVAPEFPSFTSASVHAPCLAGQRGTKLSTWAAKPMRRPRNWSSSMGLDAGLLSSRKLGNVWNTYGYIEKNTHKYLYIEKYVYIYTYMHGYKLLIVFTYRYYRWLWIMEFQWSRYFEDHQPFNGKQKQPQTDSICLRTIQMTAFTFNQRT